MNLKEIGEKRQKKWKETDLYKVKEDASKPKFYVLDMFPYPSGAALHVGHPKGYIASDCLARKKMLQGFNVLHPMGFDTFGLGTEQYAIEHKMKPQDVSKQNIEKFISQLEAFGTSYDRSRSVNTADPKYFKWTQRVFLQMYNHYYDEKLKKAMPVTDPSTQQRLAYVDYKPINWCPKCMTGLANEDLDDGKCERCGSEVEQKPMKQRVLRITKYAERLLTGLDTLSREESMKDLERNRIGKSEGTQFQMVIASDNSVISNDSEKSPDKQGDFSSSDSSKGQLSFEVYTTRIDTVFGMSFVAIAPEHPLVEKITTKEFVKDVEKYKDAAKKKSQLERTELQKEKTGVFCGAYAINPFNNEKVPVFVADYVLANYGTGVVMAVPAHDERDFAFAKKYDLPVKRVVEPFVYYADGDSAVREGSPFVERENVCVILRDPKTDMYLCVDWKEHNMHGLITGGIEKGEDMVEAAKREIYEESGYKHIKFIGDPDFAMHTFFWHRVKQSNRHARFRYLIFELVNDERDEIAAEEAAVHDLVWKTKEELGTFFTVAEGSFAINFLDNENYIYTENGILHNSGEFTSLKSEEAIPAMQKWLEKKGIGGVKVNYKMQDRVFSRQRYWGEPFPILWTDVERGTSNVERQIIALDEKELPLLLPDVDNYEPTGTEEGPLANITDWVNVTLPDGTKAKRETNTMPGRAGSSRYWLRYMDPTNDTALVGKDKETYRGNVDVYIGGAEHVTRHMIYGRFWQKFLYDIGVVTHEEPFQEYHYVGLIMGEDGRKMSKRRGNVVNPDDIVDQFGSDTLRTYEMFMGPFEQTIAWNTAGISGTKKFLDKVQNLFEKIKDDFVDSKETEILLHQSIKKLTENIDEFKFNTAVSQLMILTNHLTDIGTLSRAAFETLVILASPFAPHLAEELWEQLGNEYSLFTKATWPKYDAKCLVADTITIAVQVNGKVRGTISLALEADQQEAMAAAKADERINNRIVNEPKKIIYVKGKILNIVV